MKNKLVIIPAIVIGSLVLFGGGLATGLLLAKNNGAKEGTHQTASNSGTSENMVAKTGTCTTGQTKTLARGTYTVGVDLAGGEYMLSNIHGSDDTDTGIVIYTDKATEAADHYNYAQMVNLTVENSSKIVKLDQGNYINVLASGKLSCQ